MNQEAEGAATAVRGSRVYEPPVITEVRLRPEEAVLSLCKADGGTGAIFGSACESCATLGS